MEEGCPSCCGLYRWGNNKWEGLGSIRQCVMYTWPHTPRADKLKPQEEIKIKWNTGMPFKKEEFIESGVYKFSFYYGLTKDSNTNKTIYSNEFTIKERQEKGYNSVIRCGGGSCRCMKEKECEPNGGVYIIPTGEGECSVNPDNKMCCCPGV